MTCPRCKGTLAAELYETVHVDRCQSCHGVWLDTDELAEILHVEIAKFTPEFTRASLSKASQGIPESEKASHEPCPKCSKPMSPMNFAYSSGIHLDVCSQHGIWFDRGELEHVQAFHEAWESRKNEIKKAHQHALKQEEAAFLKRWEDQKATHRNRSFFSFFLFDWVERLSR